MIAFDSYLTVGQEQADLTVSPGEGGADAITAWGVSEAAAIATEDGAIFYMDPDSGPASDGAMIFAQLTLADATVAAGGTAGANLQGQSVGGGEDWQGYAATVRGRCLPGGDGPVQGCRHMPRVERRVRRRDERRRWDVVRRWGRRHR